MKIGIIGGGQLALMMVQSSPEHTYFVIDPNPHCSVRNLPGLKLFCNAYDDTKALALLNEQCDFVTYEFENVPSSKLGIFGSKLNPNAKVLKISQNRLREKNIATSLNIKTPRYFAINSINELSSALHSLDQKGILKTQEGGYDGKGQVRITDGKITSDAIDLIATTQCILEELIDFEFETSVILSRDVFGNTVFYPATKNIHSNGILQQTRPLENIDVTAARHAAMSIANHLNIIGTLCVEFFASADDFIFNEIAPRVHNSGHWTIEGTSTSQFKNHIKAITNQQVDEPQIIGTSMMINIFGKQYEKAKNLQLPSEAHFHSYYKDKAVPGRKMGHITVQGNDPKSVEVIISKLVKEIT